MGADRGRGVRRPVRARNGRRGLIALPEALIGTLEGFPSAVSPIGSCNDGGPCNDGGNEGELVPEILSSDPEFFSSEQGAYLLVIGLERPIDLPCTMLRRRLRIAPMLPAGWYVYSGSARGPGGLRARIARHLRREKCCHWHVDQLTCAAAGRVWGLAFPGGDQCALLRRFLVLEAFSVPLPGFGSSDCRSCPAHLLGWTPADPC